MEAGARTEEREDAPHAARVAIDAASGQPPRRKCAGIPRVAAIPPAGTDYGGICESVSLAPLDMPVLQLFGALHAARAEGSSAHDPEGHARLERAARQVQRVLEILSGAEGSGLPPHVLVQRLRALPIRQQAAGRARRVPLTTATTACSSPPR